MPTSDNQPRVLDLKDRGGKLNERVLDFIMDEVLAKLATPDRIGVRDRDGYKNGYSGEKRRAWIFTPTLLTALFSVVRRGGLVLSRVIENAGVIHVAKRSKF